MADEASLQNGLDATVLICDTPAAHRLLVAVQTPKPALSTQTKFSIGL